jgi:hypothetical protein
LSLEENAVTTTTGTVIDGIIQLDGAIDLPNGARVNVTLDAIVQPSDRENTALMRFLKRAVERPVHSGGVRYTRDELHERS